MPTKTWVVGEEVLAADFNTFVQKQVVATFANAAARDAAIPAPTDGMLVYLADVNSAQLRTGGVWRGLGYGIIGNAALLADSGGYANTFLPSTLSVAVTVPAARKLRLSLSVLASHFAGGPTHERYQVQEGGTIIMTAIQACAGSQAYVTTSTSRIVSATAGTHTYQLWVSTDVGTSALVGNPAEPTNLMVQDVGPQ